MGQADATRILIPMNRCENVIVGVDEVTVATMVEGVLKKLDKILKS